MRQATTGGCPLIFDVTHALQRRDPATPPPAGDEHRCSSLAKAGVAVGIAGLFLEAHPDPDKRCAMAPARFRWINSNLF
jgi:2-dehydro-3-deoxyphosphooctonate aldolase (KDO 8-P synthase)